MGLLGIMIRLRKDGLECDMWVLGLLTANAKLTSSLSFALEAEGLFARELWSCTLGERYLVTVVAKLASKYRHELPVGYTEGRTARMAGFFFLLNDPDNPITMFIGTSPSRNLHRDVEKECCAHYFRPV